MPVTETLTAEARADMAEEFLRRCGFPAIPESYIYVFRSRPPQGERPAEKDSQCYSSPEKIHTNWWDTKSHLYAQTYCTAAVKSRNSSHAAEDCIGTPIAWFDVDLIKKFGGDGDDFYRAIKTEFAASCFIRSSQYGVQGIFVLDKPVMWHGNKTAWNAEIGDFVADMCYRTGGDPKVVQAQNLMRLPGSLNVKPEYKTSWTVTSDWRKTNGQDRIYSIAELKRHYECDPLITPFSIYYSIKKVIEKYGYADAGSGCRHPFYVALAGSLRLGCLNTPFDKQGQHEKRIGGLDKNSVITLFKRLTTEFGDDDDRSTEAKTTFKRNIEEGIGHLGSYQEDDWKPIQKELDPIIHEWAALKTWYCKRRGIEWTPENPPTLVNDDEIILDEFGEIVPSTKVGNGAFFIKDGRTLFVDDKGNEAQFSNFVLRPTATLVKDDEKSSKVWRCEAECLGKTYHFEVDSDALTSMARFKHCLSGRITPAMTCLATRMWDLYVDWLGSICPATVIHETTYYGVLGVAEDKPSLLLPNRPHETQLWLGNSEDTAIRDVFLRDFSEEVICDFLRGFGQHYPGYHEDKFIYSALGWFCSCPISSFIREKLSGFPTMLITGLQGSGKTITVNNVLAPLFGSNMTHAFGATTTFSIKRNLVSNNIAPMVVDEYRDNDETKTEQLQAIVRSLWDTSTMSSGTQNGGVRKERLVAPLCLLGEHQYSDAATLDRTFCIRINRAWVESAKKHNSAQKAKLAEKSDWLQARRWQGILGNLLVKWLEDHLTEIGSVIDEAIKIVGSDKYVKCPLSTERKKIGFVAIIAGLIILNKIYAAHNVPFFLDLPTMLTAIYDADSLEDGDDQHDAGTLRRLFQATDTAIIEAMRSGRSLKNYLYAFKIDDPSVIYFDAKRWQQVISAHIKRSSSATLLQDTAFIELLRDSARQEESVIMAYGDEHPLFKQNCVTVNIDKIENQYHVNAASWKFDINGLNEDE